MSIKIPQNLQEDTCVGVCFLIKLEVLDPVNFAAWWLLLDLIFSFSQTQIWIAGESCLSITVISLGFKVQKPNKKIMISITSSLSLVLKLSETYSTKNLRKEKCLCKWLLQCEGKILIFIKSQHCFWSY